MYSTSDLSKEIDEEIARFDHESVLRPDYITNAVMQRHPDIDGEDASFYAVLCRVEVRNQVGKHLGKRFNTTAESQAERDAQLVLEGFERLQKRYLLADGEEIVAIRVEDMTSAQRRAKAAELRAMGAGCYQHADELDRYDAQRAASEYQVPMSFTAGAEGRA